MGANPPGQATGGRSSGLDAVATAWTWDLLRPVRRELRGGAIAELPAELDGIGAIGFARIRDFELVTVEIHHLIEGDVIAIDLTIR